MNIYPWFLQSHNLLRWLLLVTALISIIMAYRGWFLKKRWSKTDNILGVTLSSLADLQLLIGLGLYFFLSPFTKPAMKNMAEAMKNAELRFYAVEHLLIMVIAIVVIHIGRTKSKKAETDLARHRLSAIFYSIGLILILSAIPWNRALFL